jgi:hypothetical protein
MSEKESKGASSAEIRKAEKKVRESTTRFERSMDQLETRIEATQGRIARVRELAGRPGRVASRAIASVGEDPLPALSALIALGGVIGTVLYLRRRRLIERLAA